MPSSDTILGLLERQVKRKPDAAALLERHGDRWFPFTWREWRERSRALAAALMSDGVVPTDHVGIFSYSRRQWVEADIAILMAGAQTVTLYQSLSKETADFILEDSGCRVLFVEGPVQLRTLFGEDKKAPIPAALRRIIYTVDRQLPAAKPGAPAPVELTIDDTVPKSLREMLVPFEDYLERGRAVLLTRAPELDARVAAVDGDTLAKVVYTSGTTGQPKGSMLSHGNLTAVVETIEEDLGILPNDVCLLFLPLAHVYAQLTYHAALRCGFTLAFARSMLTAIDDAQSVKPDFFTTVPRLFEKIHAGVLYQVEQGGGLKRKIFDWACEIGYRVSEVKQRGGEVTGLLSVQAAAADRLVFSKLKARLGGKVRFMVSGGAPLQRSLLEFFHAAGLMIYEGYGMTENASLSNFNRPGGFRFGTVGQALCNTEVQIADDGEILVKGPGVMRGYLNQPEETAAAIDASGWLHTGDIGQIDKDGYLTITDRKKDIIVTSGGKNVAPAPIEAKLSRIRFVSQAVVFGDGRKYLTALVTLDLEYAQAWAKEHGVEALGDALAHDEALIAAIEAEVATVNRGLESYETIKRFAVLPRDFSMDRGEVTPSLKLRRRVIERHFGDLIDGLYPPESGRC